MSESVQLEADASAPQDKSSSSTKLVEAPETANDTGLKDSLLETPGTSPATATTEQKGMTLKGMLMMVVCCGAPFLLLAALGLFGVSLAGAGSALMSVALVLACSVGMYLMMRMMMMRNNNNNSKRIETPQHRVGTYPMFRMAYERVDDGRARKAKRRGGTRR